MIPRNRFLVCATCVVSWLVWAAPTAAADEIITKSGRVLQGKVTEKDANTYHVKLQTAEFDLSKDQVKDVVIEGDMSTYQPKDDKEREALAKGLVLSKGQWITKDQYQKELDKENSRRKKEMDEQAKHLQFADGWKFETQHFKLQGNCPREIIEDLASVLEEFYALMNTKIGMKASPGLARKKMSVMVFRDREDYFKAGASPGGSAGWFSQYDESLNFYYDYEDPAFTRHVMLHEGTHLLTYLANSKFEPPAWINEGMAEYFGSSRVTGERGKRKMEPGQMLDYRMQLLQEMEKTRYIPIDKWLAYSRSYRDVDAAGGSVYEHYAYWWAFCHFLAKSPKYDKKFMSYFKDLYSLNGFSKEVGYAFSQSGVEFSVKPEEYTSKLISRLGVKDINALDAEFRAWVKEQKPVGSRGYFIVGRDLSFERKLDEALKNLDKAIEKGYITSECYAYRARVWYGKEQFEKSIADWHKAIELNPVEPEYRIGLARTLRTVRKRPEAIQQLKIACELDPYDPWVRYLLEMAEAKGE